MATTVINRRHAPADWKLDPKYVYIGRPSKWGNPFNVEVYGRRRAVMMYREGIEGNPEMLAAVKAELKDKILVCYCHPLSCHGDVLAEIADR